MKFADNWTRVFVVITFLTFGEAQIIGGIVPNLIAFGLFLGAIDTLLQREKWLKCSAGKTRINSCRSYGWSWKKIAGIYGVSPTTSRWWSDQ